MEKLETLTQIEEYIKHYENLIDEKQWSNEFGAGQVMQSIKNINNHDIDIFTKCIARLNERFGKLVLTLK